MQPGPHKSFTLKGDHFKATKARFEQVPQQAAVSYRRDCPRPRIYKYRVSFFAAVLCSSQTTHQKKNPKPEAQTIPAMEWSRSACKSAVTAPMERPHLSGRMGQVWPAPLPTGPQISYLPRPSNNPMEETSPESRRCFTSMDNGRMCLLSKSS